MKYKFTSGVLLTITPNCNITSMTINKKQRVTLFLNPKVLKQAKAQAIVEETSLTTLIEKALSKYLPNETTIKKTSF